MHIHTKVIFLQQKHMNLNTYVIFELDFEGAFVLSHSVTPAKSKRQHIVSSIELKSIVIIKLLSEIQFACN